MIYFQLPFPALIILLGTYKKTTFLHNLTDFKIAIIMDISIKESLEDLILLLEAFIVPIKK